MLYQIPSVSENTDADVIKAAKIKGLKKNQYMILALGEHSKEVINKERIRLIAESSTKTTHGVCVECGDHTNLDKSSRLCIDKCLPF